MKKCIVIFIVVVLSILLNGCFEPLDKIRIKAVKEQLNILTVALQAYYDDNEVLPEKLEVLQSEDYLTKDKKNDFLLDPWKIRIKYIKDDKNLSYTLISDGPDRRESNDDIKLEYSQDGSGYFEKVKN